MSGRRWQVKIPIFIPATSRYNAMLQTTFEFYCPLFSGWKYKVSEITTALCKSSTLKKVVCRDPYSGDSVLPVYASKSLESIVIIQQEWAANSEGYNLLDATDEMERIVRYEDDHDCTTSGYWWRNNRPLEVRTASPVLPYASSVLLMFII